MLISELLLRWHLSFHLLNPQLTVLELAFEVVNLRSESIDLTEEFSVLMVLAGNLNLLLLLGSLICLNCLMEANLEMVPDPIQLSKWTLTSPLVPFLLHWLLKSVQKFE